MSKKLISIIIVNFNNIKYLKKSINSALNQTYDFKEIIVVDDRSTDGSLEELKRFKNKIKLVQTKKKTNYGSLNQINSYLQGVKKSNGHFIFFLDSDDYFKKKKVEIVTNYFFKNKNLNIIFDLPIYKFNKKLIKRKFFQKFFILSSWPRFTPQSCIAIKKSFALELFKNINKKRFYSVWFDFRIAIYAFIKFGNIFVIKKYLTYYRQLKNSASSEYKLFSKNWWFRRNEAHDFFSFIEKKFDQKKKISIDLIFTKFINFFING